VQRTAALNEERVGIVALRQHDAASSDASSAKTVGQLLCRMLAALVGIDIEGEIVRAWTMSELAELGIAKMGSQRAGHVFKACLP